MNYAEAHKPRQSLSWGGSLRLCSSTWVWRGFLMIYRMQR